MPKPSSYGVHLILDFSEVNEVYFTDKKTKTKTLEAPIQLLIILSFFFDKGIYQYIFNYRLWEK